MGFGSDAQPTVPLRQGVDEQVLSPLTFWGAHLAPPKAWSAFRPKLVQTGHLGGAVHPLVTCPVAPQR